MAGFQKYPFPRYIMSAHWTVNKNWRRNSFHVIVPIFLLNFMFFRFWSITAVIYLIQYRNVPRGYYVDPSSDDAPK